MPTSSWPSGSATAGQAGGHQQADAKPQQTKGCRFRNCKGGSGGGLGADSELIDGQGRRLNWIRKITDREAHGRRVNPSPTKTTKSKIIGSAGCDIAGDVDKSAGKAGWVSDVETSEQFVRVDSAHVQGKLGNRVAEGKCNRSRAGIGEITKRS